MEVLWQISLKLGMSIHMDKRMMHAKWHCTPYVNNGVMALCILKKMALLFPETYLGSAFADFIETWYEYIYGLEDDARQMALYTIC